MEVDDSGAKRAGHVKEKTTFPGSPNKPATTRYFIELDGGVNTALVDEDHVFRPPRTFTKVLLRSFLRHAIEHELFDNAPWTIKDDVAREFKIDNTLPRHLTQDAIQAWRKVRTALEKSKVELARVIPKRADDFEGMTRTIIEHKGKMPTDLVTRYAQAHKAVEDPSSIPSHQPASGIPIRPNKTGVLPSPAVAVPEVKYPREDLEVKPRAAAGPKPPLNFVVDEQPRHEPDDDMQSVRSITSDSWGKALSIWSTLNIHSKFFILDSFTYDDFVDCMLYHSLDSPCELFEEIHCALLKALVNKEGEAEAMIPAISDLNVSSDTSQEASAASSPKREASTAPDPPNCNPTSGSSSPLSEVDQTRLGNSMANGAAVHCAKAMLDNYSWMARIKDRAFENGGWQVAMIGLLYHLTLVDWIDDAPDKALRELAPLRVPATRDTARRTYAELDVNLRLGVLECAIMLACTSKAFKESMETRANQQTTDRKDKTDAQRRRKPLVEELNRLDNDRKMTRPEDYDDKMTNGDVEPDKMEIDGSEHDVKPPSVEDSEDSDSDPMRGRRRSGRASDLKRKHAELEKEKEAKIAEAKQVASSTEKAAYEEILANITAKKAEITACENEVNYVDGKLRENSCHRTRCLGVDRYCNRYWWFERNGMPFLGHEDSSTAEHGYMNGRLWIQGPGALEREGFFDVSDEDATTFRSWAGMTPTERRQTEGDRAVLDDDTQWAYYSTPDEIRALIAWMDDRGNREKRLQKELQKWASEIFSTMRGREEYYQDLNELRRQSSEEPIGVATRKKLHSSREKLKHPCLAWSNSEATRQLGLLHSEGQGRNKMRGIARPKGQSGFFAVNQPAGKRETRRGTKY